MIYNNNAVIIGHKQPSTDGKIYSTSNINQLESYASLHNSGYKTLIHFGGCNTGYKCAKWST